MLNNTESIQGLWFNFFLGIIAIRSCLASLESLEPELVPALTAYYLNHDRSLHQKHLKMLSDHWQTEVLELEELIDGIVDPAAFCQVYHLCIMVLKNRMNSGNAYQASVQNLLCSYFLFITKIYIKIYLKTTGCEAVNVTELASDTVLFWALVWMMINFWDL